MLFKKNCKEHIFITKRHHMKIFKLAILHKYIILKTLIRKLEK